MHFHASTPSYIASELFCSGDVDSAPVAHATASAKIVAKNFGFMLLLPVAKTTS